MYRYNKVTSEAIAEFLNTELQGKSVIVQQPCDIENIIENSVVFIKHFNLETVSRLNAMNEVFAICTVEYKGLLHCSHVLCENPRLYYLRIIKHYFYNKPEPSIHSTAIISQPENLGKGISIGAYSIIGEDVYIGNDTIIGNHVTITGNVMIGENCWIKSGAIIGEEGFGFEPNEQGIPEHFPQIGRISIGDNVFIGANSTVEIAALSVTSIADNVKIDDLVQIGHNTRIGINTLIMSGVVLCGGVSVGKNCWIAPNSCIRQGLYLGDDAVLGLSSVVVKDVPSRTVYMGNPARFFKNVESKDKL